MRRLFLVLAFMIATTPALAQHTYYVDYVNGLDSHTSTQAQSKSTPWKTVRGMANSSGNASTYTVVAGDVFVFKAGIAWDYHIWPFSLQSGSGSSSTVGCTGANCVTYTVDHTWFDSTGCTNAGYSSTALCRPILDGGGWLVVDSSCNYDQSTGSLTFLVKTDTKSNIIFDGFELKNICSSTGKAPTFGNGTYIYTGTGAHITISKNYFHGAIFPSTCTSNPGGTIKPCGDYWAAVTGLTTCSAADTTEFHDNFVDGTDATNASNGQGWYSGKGVYGSPNTVYRNYFLNIGQALDPACWATIFDNTFKNASAQSISFLTNGTGTHPHLINATNPPFNSQIYQYNNLIDTVFSGQLDQGPSGGTPANRFIFNEVVTNMTVTKTFNMSANFFNITCEAGTDSGTPANVCYQVGTGGTAVLTNLHTITTASPPYTGTPLSTTTLLTQSKATANSQGYTYAQTYQFSPTASVDSTVGAGTNQTAVCNTITDTAAKAACKMDTAYGVVADLTNHVIVAGTGRTPVARPTTGAWDIGAYQF